MGYPISFTELFPPKLLLFALLLLPFIRKLISSLVKSLGLAHFLDPQIAWRVDRSDCLPDPEPHLLSSELIRELLPVVRVSDLVEPPESCAVCLHQYDGGDEVRLLTSCRHIFHRSCLDRWMDHHHRTCPLCRTPFVPDETLWASAGFSDFIGGYSQITSGL